MATFPIYEIYVELEGYEPKMWRKFTVMNNITMSRLAYILMTLFELRNRYSYEFRKDEMEMFLQKHNEYANHPERLQDLNKEFKKLRYGITSKKNTYMFKKAEGFEPMQDATKVQLKDVLKSARDYIYFFYDPETNWKIKIILDKVVIDKSCYPKDLPNIIDGSGYGIIEKCGGIKQLQNFREELKKKQWRIGKIDYKYYSAKGETSRLLFDKFDVDDMNYRIKILPKAYQEQYENNYYLAKRQINVMKRRYKIYRKKR